MEFLNSFFGGIRRHDNGGRLNKYIQSYLRKSEYCKTIVRTDNFELGISLFESRDTINKSD